jgi:hypothetical protein
MRRHKIIIMLNMCNNTHDWMFAKGQAIAEKLDEKKYWFLRILKQRSVKKVDRIALELHQAAFGIVDCTKCANCCRTLRVVVLQPIMPCFLPV